MQVITELDVYEEVGSNNALILSVSTSTADGNLTITFEGVIGSPSISAICIRTGPPSSTQSRAYHCVVVSYLFTSQFIQTSYRFLDRHVRGCESSGRT